MTSAELSATEARYVEEIAADCRGELGPGADLVDLRVEATGGGVTLIARYRLGGRDCESAATGETVLAAHAALRARIVIDRVRLGFSALVERP